MKRLSYKNIQDIYPLSSMQEGMYFFALYNRSSSIYLQQYSLRIKGNFRLELVKKSIEELFKRHDILRTVFTHEKKNIPLQVVLRTQPVDFYYNDIKEMPSPGHKEEFLRDYKEKDRGKPFDLNKDILLRTALIRLAGNEYEFIWSFHHILMDGWCMGILFQEFFEIYRSLVTGRDYRLPPVKQYSEYIEWLERRNKNKSKLYWQEYLAGYAESIRLPGKKEYVGEMDEQHMERVELLIDVQRTALCNEAAGKNQVTLNTLMQVIWGVLLCKLNNTNDAVFGQVVSGRPPGIENVESIIGLFINSVPLRVKYDDPTTFAELLRTVQYSAVESEPHHYYSLAEIQANTSLKQNPLDHLLAFENFPMADVKGKLIKIDFDADNESTLQVSNIDVFGRGSYDFTVIFLPGSRTKGMEVTWIFDPHGYDAREIQRVSTIFELILKQIIADDRVKVKDIEIMPREERRRILYEFNETRCKMADMDSKTLHEVFEEQVKKTPDNIIINYPLRSNISNELILETRGDITYKKLNETANQLARHLCEQGITCGEIVGIMINSSLEMVLALLAVLKAGGAYLPLDPAYPADRIKYIIKDSGIESVLTAGTIQESANFTRGNMKIEFIDILAKGVDLYVEDGANLGTGGAISSIAYVIYTSGTTGWPKGVLIEHRNVVNALLHRREQFKLNPRATILQTLSYSFDGFVLSFFAPIISGSRVILLKEEDRKNIIKLKAAIIKHRVTHFMAVALLYKAIIDGFTKSEAASLEVAHIGADRIIPDILDITRENYKNIEVSHEYGVTEATIISTVHRHQEKDRAIHIGRPIWNTRIYILDRYQRLQPAGVPGEICIGGAGVARGYLNNSELSREKFIPVHYPGSKRIYKTGDLGRWLYHDNGSIEFLGRIDTQVKVRGFRIEAGEIERRLLKLEGIKEAVVVDKRDGSGNTYLCAYIVPEEADKRIDVQGICSRLSDKLPDYMIPSHFVRLEKIPLTPNNKVDKNRLPDPELKTVDEFIAPRNEREEKLAVIWSEILQVEKSAIGIDADFFQLGGHSLKATILVGKIHKEFQVKIELKDFFKLKTIKEIAELIEKTVPHEYASIEAVEKRDYHRVSPAQKRLYLTQQLDDKDSIRYNMMAFFQMEGKTGQEKIEGIFKQLIKRHESLRTSFVLVEEVPVQRIYDKVEFKIPYYDLIGESLGHRRPRASASVIKDFIRPFNLSAAPLLRVGLIKLSEEKHILMVDMNHIISDGWSVNLLTKEMTAFFNGTENQLPLLRLQYKDYSRWQNRLVESGEIKNQEKYWLNRFRGEIPVLDLPIDYQRPLVQGFAGSSFNFEIGKEQTGQLKQLCLKTEITMFMLLLAIFNILLAKLSSQEDIIVGSPIAGRKHTDLENIMGMFVNMLALRNQPAGDKTFAGWLPEVKACTLGAYQNQDYQYEELVDKVVKTRDMSRNPLFDAVFVLQNLGHREFECHQLKITPYDYEEKVSQFDLLLVGEENENNVFFNFLYCTELFKKDTIKRLASYFKKIISAVLAEPGKKIAEVELVSEEEKQEILYEFNDTTREYPGDKTVSRLFEDQVDCIPDHIAVNGLDQGLWPMALTYRELNRKSHQLGNMLMTRGVGGDKLAALMLSRSIPMIVGILAVLKTGAAYLPLDIDLPGARIKYILKDTRAELLLAKKNLTLLYGDMIETLDIENPDLYINAHNEVNIESTNTPGDLCYVMYTSGSTGGPKGVAVEHKNVIRLVKNPNYVKLTDATRVLQTGAPMFDATTLEVWGPLLNGGWLVLVDKDMILNADRLSAALTKYQINLLWLSSPLFNQLIRQNSSMFSTLEWLLVGGDVLSPKHIAVARKSNKNLKVVNGYGPTENTTFSACYLIDKDFTGDIPIGKPVTNSTAYILDQAGHLQSIGVRGELYVGGDGVARGYLNNPELTAEKFNHDLWNYLDYHDGRHRSSRSHESYVLYKTGDLARWLPDGNIEFLGRKDHQVKISGFRIELGEIENQLLKHPEIEQTVVIPGRDKEGEKDLCAYIISKNRIPVPELRKALSVGLPGYMIPAHFVFLDCMPLNPNGKINYSALPTPEMQTGGGYIAPSSQTETCLAETWAEVLQIEKGIIGIHTNFFDLGGNSIKAIKVISALKKRDIGDILVSDIFQYQSVKEMADYINGRDVDKRRVIETTTAAEQWFAREFTARGEWLRCNAGEKSYQVLFIEDTLMEKNKYEDILWFCGKHLRQELLPHYVMPISRKPGLDTDEIHLDGSRLAELLQLETGDIGHICEPIGDCVKRETRRFRRAFDGNRVIKEYKVSPVQQGHLSLPERFSRALIPLDRYVHVKRLEDAFLEVIRNQGLLRSILVDKSGEWYWNELAPPDHIDIPCIDLSPYEPAMIEKLITEMINQETYKNYQSEGSILYRVILFKKNLRDHVLFLSFDHSIFDRMSRDIIEKSLLNYYQSKESERDIPVKEIKPYSDYIAQITAGPQDINVNELIKLYHLEEYHYYKEKCEEIFKAKRRGNFTHFIYDVEFSGSIREENAWELLYTLFTLTLKRYFGLAKIPLTIVSYGRRYQQGDYFETVGEFLDLIPVLAQTDEENPFARVEDVRKLVEAASKYNINFLSLMHDNVLGEEWKAAVNFIIPTGNSQGINNFIAVFNFEGKVSEEETVQTFQAGFGETLVPGISGILCDAAYDSNRMYLLVTTPFEKDRETLKKILDEESRKLMN